MSTEYLTYYECSFTVPKQADRKGIHDIVYDKLNDAPVLKKGKRFQYCIQKDATSHLTTVTMRNKTPLDIDLEQVEKIATFVAGEKRLISVEVALLHSITNENLKQKQGRIAFSEINQWICEVMMRNGFMLKGQANKIHQDICISKHGRKDLLIPRSTITMEGCISDPTLFSLCWMNGIGTRKCYGLGMLNDVTAILNDRSIIKG